MNFHHHHSNNMILGASKDMPHCQNLPATMLINDATQETTITSFWKPSPEELAHLNANGSVMLFVFGTFHPPVWVTTTE